MGLRRGEIFLAPPYQKFISVSARLPVRSICVSERFFSVTVLGSNEDLSLLMRISNFLAQFLID